AVATNSGIPKPCPASIPGRGRFPEGAGRGRRIDRDPRTGSRAIFGTRQGVDVYGRGKTNSRGNLGGQLGSSHRCCRVGGGRRRPRGLASISAAGEVVDR